MPELPFKLHKGFSGTFHVRYRCPNCKRSLENLLTEAGSRDSCPNCDREFEVPGIGARDEQDRLLRIAKDQKENKNKSKNLVTVDSGPSGKNKIKQSKIDATNPNDVVPRRNLPARLCLQCTACAKWTDRSITCSHCFNKSWNPGSTNDNETGCFCSSCHSGFTDFTCRYCRHKNPILINGQSFRNLIAVPEGKLPDEHLNATKAKERDAFASASTVTAFFAALALLPLFIDPGFACVYAFFLSIVIVPLMMMVFYTVYSMAGGKP